GRGGSRSAAEILNICRPPIQRDAGFRPGPPGPLIRAAWRVASTGRSGLTWGPATFLKGATPHPADSIAPPTEPAFRSSRRIRHDGYGCKGPTARLRTRGAGR